MFFIKEIIKDDIGYYTIIILFNVSVILACFFYRLVKEYHIHKKLSMFFTILGMFGQLITAGLMIFFTFRENGEQFLIIIGSYIISVIIGNKILVPIYIKLRQKCMQIKHVRSKNNKNNNSQKDIEISTSNKQNIDTTIISKEDTEEIKEYSMNLEFNLLLVACASKDYTKAEKILLESKTKIDINEKTIGGNTLLMIAIEGMDLKIARLLLDNDANINEQDNEGWTALMIAADKSNLEAVKLLLEYKPNINKTNNYKATALLCAADKGNLEIIKLLVNNGADVNAEDDQGWTAMKFAEQLWRSDIVSYLKGEGEKR